MSVYHKFFVPWETQKWPHSLEHNFFAVDE
jgi:hypothetical protein